MNRTCVRDNNTDINDLLTKVDKSIELLIKSSNLGFIQSIELLCLIILKRFFNKQTNENQQISIENIEKELSKFTKEKKIDIFNRHYHSNISNI